jgi:steroid delta-isomerase
MDNYTSLPEISLPIDTQVARVSLFYERLTPASLLEINRYYAVDARFKDPFNEVTGISAIIGIFEHMFATVQEPRFTVKSGAAQSNQAFLTWEFHFRLSRRDPDTQQCIRGVTHFQFNEQGRVVMHRDYWDAAEELYEKLPGIGVLMRWLRRRSSR